MRQTEYRRRNTALTEEIFAEVQKVSQDELNWLFRQIRYKVRRLDRQRVKVTTASPRLQKSYVVSGNLWDFFVQRMRRAVTRAIVNGAIKLAALQRSHFTSFKPVEFDPEEFAKFIEPEIGERIVGVSNTIKRMVGAKVVGWYNSPGVTMQSLVDQLKPTFGEARARLIAQTEVTYLNSEVKRLTAEQIGATEWWWSTRRDNLVCKKPLKGPDGKIYNGCRELHGKTFAIGLPMPPDGSHIGCRCDAVIVPPSTTARAGTTKPVIEGLLMQKFDENQPRDDSGRWTDTGRGGKAIPDYKIKLRDWGGEADANREGQISINSTKWRELDDRTKEYIITHEIIHQTVEDLMLEEYVKNPAYMDEVADILTIKTNDSGVKMFAGGNMKLNEAVAETLAAGIMGEKIPLVKPEAYQWVDETLARYGYSKEAIKEATQRTLNAVEEEIDFEDSLNKADFVESEHPRDEDGKFTEKGTGVSGGGSEPAYKQTDRYKEFTAAIERYHNARDDDERYDALNDAESVANDYRFGGSPEIAKEMREDYFDGNVPDMITAYKKDTGDIANFGNEIFYTDFDKAKASLKSGETLSAFDLESRIVIPIDKQNKTCFADSMYFRDPRKVDLNYEPPKEMPVKYKLANTEYNDNINRVFNIVKVPEAVQKYKENHPGTEITATEYVEKCEERLKKEVDNSDVCVRLSTATLNRVFEQGSYKSVFETLKSEAGAWEGSAEKKERYLEHRRRAENEMFGTPKDKTEGRPVYGYLAGKGTTHASSEVLEQYGNVAIVLKDSVRERTTFTVGDSLDDVNIRGLAYVIPNGEKIWAGRGAPSKLTDPRVQSLTYLEHFAGKDWLTNLEEAEANPGDVHGAITPRYASDYEYWEAQINGGFSVSDIASVSFIGKEPSSKTIKMLDKAGISWKVEKGHVEKMYLKADQPEGVLIARDDYLELYALDDHTGYVVNTETGKRYPAHELASILSRGYWEMVEDEDLEKWEEQKHPRKKDGKFAPKGMGEAGGSAETLTERPAKEKPASNPEVIPETGNEVEGRPQMGKNFDISAERKMFEKGNYTPEQRLRFKKRELTVKYAETEPFNDKLTQKDYIDKYIRRGWYPTNDDEPYALVNPEGTRKRNISREGMKDYLDVVLNRGEFKANYDLPEGAKVVPERGKKPEQVKTPEPDEPTGFEGLDGAQVVEKLLKTVESQEYDKNDKQLLHLQGKLEEAKERLKQLVGDGKFDGNNPKMVEALDDVTDWAGLVGNAIASLRESRANEAVKAALKVKSGVKIKRNINQDKYNFSKRAAGVLAEGIDGFEAIVSSKVNLRVTDVAFWYQTRMRRSSYNEHGDSPIINCGLSFKDTHIVHELGHHLERYGDGVREAATEFFNKRTTGDKLVHLNMFGKHYRDDEVAKPDKFIDPYVGKIYSDGSTEVVSVGLAAYYSDPVGFLKKDPEHFAFIYDVVHGKFAQQKGV